MVAPYAQTAQPVRRGDWLGCSRGRGWKEGGGHGGREGAEVRKGVPLARGHAARAAAAVGLLQVPLRALAGSQPPPQAQVRRRRTSWALQGSGEVRPAVLSAFRRREVAAAPAGVFPAGYFGLE